MVGTVVPSVTWLAVVTSIGLAAVNLLVKVTYRVWGTVLVQLRDAVPLLPSDASVVEPLLAPVWSTIWIAVTVQPRGRLPSVMVVAVGSVKSVVRITVAFVLVPSGLP